MKTDLVIVNTVPAVLDFDFEAAKLYVEGELEKYDVVVTLETLPGGKELAKELNATATQIDETRKEKVAEASVDIKKFDENVKALVIMCKEGRVKILDQIKVFEDETRKKIWRMLHDLREELFFSIGVDEEFVSAEFDDLIILSNLTKAGSLAGKAKSELEKRVNADKQKQDMVERRLLLLENASYKAGLLAPLTRVHVNSFLFSDDESYNEQLDKIIDSEIERQKIAEEATRKRTLRESAQDEPSTAVAEQAAPAPVTEEKPAYVKPVAPVGQTMHVIQATFEVPVPDNIEVSRVVAKLEQVMKDAGITTLKEIKVVA